MYLQNLSPSIVEPEDQFELEEEIMTALYGYQDKETHKRVVALALCQVIASCLHILDKHMIF